MATGSPDYVKSVKLLGVRPDGTLDIVALDAAGRIISVMTGEYNELSKVLATDAGGRLIAVITDPENIWGIRPLVGNAELAARLGSSNRWDRRGSVMYQDSFQNGLVYSSIGLFMGAGAGKIVSDRALTGGYSLKLVSPVVANQYVTCNQHVSFPAYTGKVGIEAHFATNNPTGTVELSLFCYTGSKYIFASLRVVLEDRKVYYVTTDEDYVDTEELVGSCENDYIWHGLKFVVDLSTAKYVRALVEEAEIDLSTKDSFVEGNPGPPFAELVFMVTTPAGGGAQTIYLDDIIVTIAEPS